MNTTRDAASVIEKLTAVRQHELADETTVEALEASGTSPPSGATTSAAGTPTDPRDQTARAKSRSVPTEPLETPAPSASSSVKGQRSGVGNSSVKDQDWTRP